MAGLVPAIHAGTRNAGPGLSVGAEKRVGILIPTRRLAAWIPGTRPGMTRVASGQDPILAPMRFRGMTLIALLVCSDTINLTGPHHQSL